MSVETRTVQRSRLEQHVEITKLYTMGGVAQKQIGRRFGVSQAHVSTILWHQGVRVGRDSRHATERP
jgi:DNA-binding transcriptional regulator LsrR (DeoR family)